MSIESFIQYYLLLHFIKLCWLLLHWKSKNDILIFFSFNSFPQLLLKTEAQTEESIFSPPLVEMTSNPSAFSVFAGVRQSVLQHQLQENAKIFLTNIKSTISDAESDEEEDAVTSIKLPKVGRLCEFKTNCFYKVFISKLKQFSFIPKKK